MTYTAIQKANGRFYLYEVDAVWDPATKNSKQKRKYLGRCDADGNLLRTAADAAPQVFEFGRTYVMYQMAQRIGLPNILDDVFGEDGKYLLATCIQRAIRTSLPRYNVNSMHRLFVPQMVCADVDSALGDVRGTIQLLDRSIPKVWNIFEKIPKGNEVMVFKFPLLRDSFESLYLDIKDRKGFIDFPPMDVYLGVSDDPSNLFYYTIRKSTGDFEKTLIGIEDEVRELGSRDITFFFDSDDSSESKISLLIGSGLSFSNTVSINSDYGTSLLAQYDPVLQNEGTLSVFNDTLVRVLDREYRIGDLRCRLLIVQDEKCRYSQVVSLQKSLHEYEAAMSKEKWNRNVLSKHRSFMVSDMFELSEGRDGYAAAERIRPKIDKACLRFGRRIILTNSDAPWEVLLQKHNRHDRYKHEINIYKMDLEDGSRIMSSLEEALSTFFNEFLCLVLHTKLSTELKTDGTFELGYYWNAMDILADLYAVNNGGKWTVSRISPEQKAVFGKLDIPEPTSEQIQLMAKKYSDLLSK